MQRFELSPNDANETPAWEPLLIVRRDTRLRAPLDSTTIYPKPGLPTNNTRPAKEKPYQEHTFALSIPLELDVDRLVLL